MRIFLTIVLIFAGEAGFTQRIITGQVLDRNSREPIEHVDVTVYKGTSYMSTNERGYFQLMVQDGDSLLFSHEDYLPGLIAIPESDVFNVFIEKAISYPVYLDGAPSLYKYFEQNIRYPNAALIKGVEGILLMVVRVDSSGSVVDCRALNELGGNCAKVVTAVLMEIPGKWTHSDNTHSFIFPFVFKIANKESKFDFPKVVLPEGKIMEQVNIIAYNQ